MKKFELYSYIYDFVSRLIERLEEGSVRGIIAFGSVVRGDFEKGSDVDIFIDTEHEGKVSTTVKTVLNEFYSHSRQTWILRGIENQISAIVGNLDSGKWSNLKKEIISNGLVVYGQYKELPKNTKHYVLIVYDMSILKPKEKSSFLRGFLGYRLLKGKKEYRMKGLLEEISGIKLSKNVVLVAKENQRNVETFLSKSGVRFEIREVWSK